ncbi:hypothetical protein B566_EDAN009260 [Ephemera danica]|nr:hypothetical protein B566_EDAN009260 [Ephemera danica]
MGNKHSCCAYASPQVTRKDGVGGSSGIGGSRSRFEEYLPEGEESIGNLQHISEREPEDWDADPSLHPKAGTIFMERSKASIENGLVRKKSQNHLSDSRPLKKSSSCSTIFLDDSTVSQPNLKSTVKCVALAIYFHIKNRTSHRHMDIFDEKMHPLTKDGVPDNYDKITPEHRQIYKFVRTLFNAAQLTAECAIITLVYLERIVLGAILLASKVWDDQAVWNVDYCQILKDISVEDMNELERQFLEMLQFNINVPSSVYAKYYFDLRTLAEANELSFPAEPLSRDRAQRLEAMSRLAEDRVAGGASLMFGHFQNQKRSASMDNINAAAARRSVAILS